MSDATTLHIKTCKYYRTREGKRAYVAGILPKLMASLDCGFGSCQYVGFIEGHESPVMWCLDGNYYEQTDGDVEDGWDLVAEAADSGLV